MPAVDQNLSAPAVITPKAQATEWTLGMSMVAVGHQLKTTPEEFQKGKPEESIPAVYQYLSALAVITPQAWTTTRSLEDSRAAIGQNLISST